MANPFNIETPIRDLIPTGDQEFVPIGQHRVKGQIDILDTGELIVEDEGSLIMED